MSEIERIRRYVDRTGIAPQTADLYCLHQSEMKALLEEMRRDPFNAMDAIFSFGQAKGYRAAKAEARHG